LRFTRQLPFGGWLALTPFFLPILDAFHKTWLTFST